MTPQEKAQELVNKNYSIITGWKISFIKKLKVTILEDSNYQTAKQCALIAVEEIKKAHPYIPLRYMLESEALDAAIEYWNEVKAEIEKL